MEAVDIISNMTDKQLIALDRLYTTLLTGSKLVFMHTHWKRGQQMVQGVIADRSAANKAGCFVPRNDMGGGKLPDC